VESESKVDLSTSTHSMYTVSLVSSVFAIFAQPVWLLTFICRKIWGELPRWETPSSTYI